MTKSELSYSAEGSLIGDHQQESKSQKIKRPKIVDQDQKIVVQGVQKDTV